MSRSHVGRFRLTRWTCGPGPLTWRSRSNYLDVKIVCEWTIVTTGSEVDHSVDDAPRPLTVRGVPVDPNLRIMAGATLVNTFGNGALMTTFALYFTRVVGLRPTQVGLAMSAGAFAGLLVQVPAGHFADLRGPRKVLQTLTFASSVAMLGLLFARSVWALVAAIVVI